MTYPVCTLGLAELCLHSEKKIFIWKITIFLFKCAFKCNNKVNRHHFLHYIHHTLDTWHWKLYLDIFLHCTVSYMGGGIIFAFFSRFFFTDLLNDCREARKNFVPLGFPPNLGPKLSLKAENGQKLSPKYKNRKNFLGTLILTLWTTNGRNFKKNSKKKSLLEPSEVSWGMAKNEVFGHFCQFFWSNPMEISNGTRKFPQIFFCTVVRAWGSKMTIFKPKMAFPPNFSYFWS